MVWVHKGDPVCRGARTEKPKSTTRAAVRSVVSSRVWAWGNPYLFIAKFTS